MSNGDLSRMGTAKVVLKAGDSESAVIEKCPVGDVEYSFYQYAAAALNRAEVATPKLLSADASLRKLKMEYIPYPVEQAAVANDNAIAMLARLHNYPPDARWLYHIHSWSEIALEKSLNLLALPEKNARQLRHFQQCSDVLFSYPGLVSGDSNAGNWGRRENGDLVLFDWERFGKGSPAIDLAPLLKGMGTKQNFMNLAERYCWLSDYKHISGLVREITIAKAWIVTEVIVLLKERENKEFPLYLNWYKKHLPDWLSDIEGIL